MARFHDIYLSLYEAMLTLCVDRSKSSQFIPGKAFPSHYF
jgi:hypothetical protein